MNNTVAEFISNLSTLKSGELSILRTMKNKGLDEGIDGFDLFTGIWWPLREKSKSAPQRETAWLIAKLFACYPIPQEGGANLPLLMSKISRNNDALAKQLAKLNDKIVKCSLRMLEDPLGQALNIIQNKYIGMDWVKLTDTLSKWVYQSERERWIQDFLTVIKEQ